MLVDLVRIMHDIKVSMYFKSVLQTTFKIAATRIMKARGVEFILQHSNVILYFVCMSISLKLLP